MLISSRMLKLTPLIMWTSLSNAVIPSIYVPMMTDSITQFEAPEEKNKYCLLALVGLGVGEIIGATIFGYVQDHSSNKLTSLFCMVLTTVGLAVSLSFAIHY